MMPASLGAFVEARPRLFRALDRIVNRGRRVPVGRIFGFLQLYGVAALRPTRRASLRHKRETEHLEAWLAQAAETLPKNYGLAVEILRCRRLVKGYSDTHARGLSKFDRVMAKAPKLAPREDGAQWMARLVAAALMDERARRSTASRRRSTHFRSLAERASGSPHSPWAGRPEEGRRFGVCFNENLSFGWIKLDERQHHIVYQVNVVGLRLNHQDIGWMGHDVPAVELLL